MEIRNGRLRKTVYRPALVSIQGNPVIRFYDRLKEKGKTEK
jgi:hypothetical protein